MAPLISGVAIVLVFSIWPIREANGLLCFGVALGGFVASWMTAKANGDRIESVRGLKLGAWVGVISALIVMIWDLGSWAASIALPAFNPIPDYIYAAIYGIYDGLLDYVSRNPDGVEMPGRLGQYVILMVSTYLFGGFGGGVAASLFDSTARDDQPETSTETPSVGSHVRHEKNMANGHAVEALQPSSALPLSYRPPVRSESPLSVEPPVPIPPHPIASPPVTSAKPVSRPPASMLAPSARHLSEEAHTKPRPPASMLAPSARHLGAPSTSPASKSEPPQVADGASGAGVVEAHREPARPPVPPKPAGIAWPFPPVVEPGEADDEPLTWDN